MGEDCENFLADVRQIIETRVKKQLNRHLRIDPNMDPRSVIDIQMTQEREFLDHLAKKFDDNGEVNQAEMMRFLRHEWLPELRRTLRRN